MAEDRPDTGTGDPAVDAAVGPLAGLGGAPVAGHQAILEGVHERLRAALDAGEPGP